MSIKLVKPIKYSVSRACMEPEPWPANFKLRAELKLLKQKSSVVLVRVGLKFFDDHVRACFLD